MPGPDSKAAVLRVYALPREGEMIERTPEQIAAFKTNLKLGLANIPFKDMSWIQYHARRGMFADLHNQQPETPPIAATRRIVDRPVVPQPQYKSALQPKKEVRKAIFKGGV